MHLVVGRHAALKDHESFWDLKPTDGHANEAKTHVIIWGCDSRGEVRVEQTGVSLKKLDCKDF